jgi:hypothetical protein
MAEMDIATTRLCHPVKGNKRSLSSSVPSSLPSSSFRERPVASECASVSLIFLFFIIASLTHHGGDMKELSAVLSWTKVRILTVFGDRFLSVRILTVFGDRFSSYSITLYM